MAFLRSKQGAIMLPLLLLAASFASAPDAGPIVTPEWLQAHLNDPRVRVICVGGMGDDGDYAHGHIPGARLLDHMATFVSSREALAHVFERVGVTDGVRVVLYGKSPMVTGWVNSALASIGFTDVSWLDGGLQAWRADNRPLESATPAAASGTLAVRPAPDFFVDAAWLRAHLKSPEIKLLDVRSEHEWGKGHLPGATLILWQDLFADSERQKFKSPEEIRALVTRAGVKPDQQVVSYCQMGMRASLMTFALRAAGVNARVYLPGWDGWSKDSANPVVR